MNAKEKKRGLGKGFNALLSENDAAEDGSIVTLRLSEIEPNREQPRKEFEEAALLELSDSIRQHGVLQPLLVRPKGTEGYQLVAGERRWRAARMAGLTEVPVMIRPMDDQEMMELALIENLQREDLNPLEEAEGYRQLMDTHGMTQEEVAKVVGKSRPAVGNALRLLGLSDQLMQLVREEKLSSGHARALLAVPEEQREELSQRIIEEDLSVRDVERIAQKMEKKPRKTPEKDKPTTYFSEVELALTQCLGRKVKVTGSGEKGKLEIAFYSNEELRDLAARLGKGY